MAPTHAKIGFNLQVRRSTKPPHGPRLALSNICKSYSRCFFSAKCAHLSWLIPSAISINSAAFAEVMNTDTMALSDPGSSQSASLRLLITVRHVATIVRDAVLMTAASISHDHVLVTSDVAVVRGFGGSVASSIRFISQELRGRVGLDISSSLVADRGGAC